MCGIAGFTHKNWTPGPRRIDEVVATLIHRGPDQQGVFRSKACSMGATRLKIIDLATGNQPIKTDDGDTVIVFNGEIYNHIELRTELEKLGHRFHTRSDTETVLHAFIEWDKACFSRLRGMFGVALWTESSRRLVLARDRMGIKPLYIARRRDDMFFGSELKAILVHPEIDRRLSMAGLDCYLSLNYVPCPWTLVDGIEKLPPGHWLEWRDGEVSSDAYWRLPYGPSREITLDSAKQELDALLAQSVSEHLLSDVPLGVWLSGGIDSSTILHYAARASTSRLKTLSISFLGKSFDETSYIREVAAQYGTDHEEFDLNPGENLSSAIEEFAYYNDEPDADAGALPLWFLSKMTKTKVTVALSGEGGDELFGGYLTYRANRLAGLARQFPSAAIRLGLAAARLWSVSDDKISLEYMAKRFLEGCLLPPERAHVYWNGTFSDASKADLVNAPLPGALDRILGELRPKLAGGDDVSPYLWFDQKYFLPDDILMKVDRMSMAHAVEARPPLLDHRIVEFMASLPASFKVRGSRLKFLLKELMKDKLPASVIRRKKTGLDIPTHEWLRGPLKPLMLDALRSGTSEHAELFRPAAIDRCASAHIERRANLGYHLWGLMILFLWMRKWKIQTEHIPAPSLKVAGSILAAT
ncbi:MAG TPA: asparagine synthase (glutamine-hydrolyzing) [Candidatus Acidoferrales bacterium]|nr:asparagine synthase (glutamine-hydrolyzing) [Candidatus Acidoferrales bacterium]